MDLEYVTKLSDAEKKAFLKAWKATIPKFKKQFGIPIIYGTGGEIEIKSFNKLWHSESDKK